MSSDAFNAAAIAANPYAIKSEALSRVPSGLRDAGLPDLPPSQVDPNASLIDAQKQAALYSAVQNAGGGDDALSTARRLGIAQMTVVEMAYGFGDYINAQQARYRVNR